MQDDAAKGTTTVLSKNYFKNVIVNNLSMICVKHMKLMK